MCVTLRQLTDRDRSRSPLDVPREERGGEGFFPESRNPSVISRKPETSIGRGLPICGIVSLRVATHARFPLIVSGIAVSNAAAGGIPVGIAVARQRLQHQETSTSMRNVSLSHHTSHHATSYHHFQPDGLGESICLSLLRDLRNSPPITRGRTRNRRSKPSPFAE